MRINTRKYLKNKNEKTRGFTLIELLATVMILSLVVGIAIYVVINIIGSVKENGYKVTINNIESVADEYISEKNLFFVPIDPTDDTSNEYQCVTVQQLIDMGYFKDELLSSDVNEDDKVNSLDYIYLERKSDNKTLIFSKYINMDDNTNDKYKSLCANVMKIMGNISFDIEPSGWSQSKKVTINFGVNSNNVINYDNIKYQYKYIANGANDTTYSESNSNIAVVENITMNGKVYGYMPGIVGPVSKDVTGIDRVKPNVSMGEYNGNDKIYSNVSFNLNVIDKESGLKKSTFTKDDIKVLVGNEEISVDIELKYVSLSSGVYKYQLNISGIPRDKSGNLKIKIPGNSLEDNVGNLNDERLVDTGIKVVKAYIISYVSNSGSGNMMPSICMYQTSCTLTANTFGRAGFAFNVWKNSVGGTLKNSETFTYNYNSDITLTVDWKDIEPPTKPTTMNFVFGDWTAYSGGWTNKDLYAARNKTDRGPTGSTDNVGVVKYQISTNNSTWYDYNYDYTQSLYKMSTTGKHKRYFRACDAAGNCGASLTVSGDVDKTPPSKPSISNPTSGNTVCSSFSLGVSTTEEHSGVAYWQYSYSSSPSGSSTSSSDSCSKWITYSSSAKSSYTTSAFSASRHQSVYIRACDKAGNCSEKNSTTISIGNYSAGYSYKVAGSKYSKTFSSSTACASWGCPSACVKNFVDGVGTATWTCHYSLKSVPGSCSKSSNKCS